MREDPWNVTPLMHAAGNGHLEVVAELLRAKAKVSLTDKSFPGEGGGETALHYAAFKGQCGTAKLLLNARADVNKVSRNSGTPLAVAVGEQQLEMVQLLLEHDALPDLAGKATGWTPLHVAAFEGLFQLAKRLVDCGADVNAKDSGGQTPFMDSTHSPNLETAFFLIDHGADLEAAESDGTTCLMWAVMSENAKLVTEVLKHGVNVNALDSEGQSALDFAIRDKLPEIQALLRKAGAKTGAELCPPKKTAGRKLR
ncbi:MAG: ankyrin repeat domain-containing protein [Verrucomicrobia bacterium]|nr:ankyrin repeat domain-containing protein [Verrucomicrobiota bacterium]